MYILLISLIIVICILLILIVLVQNSKGGGLASNFSSSNQFMGVRKTADFLEKSTWTLGAALMILSMVATIIVPKAKEDTKSAIEDQINNISVPSQNVNFPTSSSQNAGAGKNQNAPQGSNAGNTNNPGATQPTGK